MALQRVRLGVRVVLTDNQRLFASLGYSRALAEADPLLGDAGAASTSP